MDTNGFENLSQEMQLFIIELERDLIQKCEETKQKKEIKENDS